ncbi:hypothetical protein IEQ34_022980 [Dendrobium chrysotoxum]|uniref:Uncharacterized protein n=1 Tax=Dendrobium chrysotoxum TaxID=161865 RepID=A0AAV7G0J6_DENCH|nr:hypothetical protein IEQ34_022980 [Dendrobium chrysotoxum]
MSDPGSGGSEFLSEFFRPSNDSELGKKKTNDSSFTPAATERERQSEERNGSGSKIVGLRHGDGLSDTKHCDEGKIGAGMSSSIKNRKRKSPIFYDCTMRTGVDDYFLCAEDEYEGEVAVPVEAYYDQGKIEAGVAASVKNQKRKASIYYYYEKKNQGTNRKLLAGEDALMCHQCQRNDKGAVTMRNYSVQNPDVALRSDANKIVTFG